MASLPHEIPFIIGTKLDSFKWNSLPHTHLRLIQSFKNFNTNLVQVLNTRNQLHNFYKGFQDLQRTQTLMLKKLQPMEKKKKWCTDLGDEEEWGLSIFEGGFEKVAIGAATILGLLLYDPDSASAASAGRMGGSSSSSTSSSSSRSSYTSSSSSRGSYSSSYAPSLSSSSTSVSYHTSTGDAPMPVLRIGSSFAIGWDALCLISFTAIICSVIFSVCNSSSQEEKKTSVIKSQVCLLGMARSLQRDLNQIAEVADTSSSKGLNYILKETVLALLRHPEYCSSSYSSVDLKKSFEEADSRFNRLSIEERGKFDEETLVNVNNIKTKKDPKTNAYTGSNNEYIVITILVVVEGALELPEITSTSDLKESLEKLGSISIERTRAVEVMWTPQEENDILLEQDLLQDYPLLKPLQDG